MSVQHPIIAMTGGATGPVIRTVRQAFQNIFYRDRLKAVIVDGDSFQRYDRDTLHALLDECDRGVCKVSSLYGPEANLLEELEDLFHRYGENGAGRIRQYLHDENQAAAFGQKPGTLTPWEQIPSDTDLLLYHGLHGAFVTDHIDIAQHVDLLLGIMPAVNLEWIQQIQKDRAERNTPVESSTRTILRGMSDYVHYMTPQFSKTHINFQRIPAVDTSDPFIARDIPTLDESYLVIRFTESMPVDFPYLLSMIHNSFMSRRNTIVLPAGKMLLVIELILTPLIRALMEKRSHKTSEAPAAC